MSPHARRSKVGRPSPVPPLLPRVLDLDAPGQGLHRLADTADHSFQANRWAEMIGPHALEEIGALTPVPHTNAGWVGAYLHLSRRAAAQARPYDAAVYERAAEFFMTDDDPRRAPARRHFVQVMREAFDVKPILVPFDSAHLPAYDVPAHAPPSNAPGSGTWVLFGGFDSYIEEWLPVISAVAARGRRVIAFDGPGQGGALEECLALTHEWERPVAAVLDYFGLEDVTLVGLSLGGALAVRAAALEPRVSRIAAWDVMEDFLNVAVRQAVPVPTWLSDLVVHLPAPVLNVALGLASRRHSLVQWGLGQGMRVTRTTTPAAFLRVAASLRTRRISPRVRGDALLLAGAQDHYVPRGQLARQASSLTGARSVTTRMFTAEEDCAAHCQVGDMALAVRTILAWEESLRTGTR